MAERIRANSGGLGDHSCGLSLGWVQQWMGVSMQMRRCDCLNDCGDDPLVKSGAIEHCRRASLPPAIAESAAVEPAKEPSEQAFDGYLCRAWGETDHTVASIVADMDRVRQFIVDQWLGDKDAPDLPQIMEVISDEIEDKDEYRVTFASQAAPVATTAQVQEDAARLDFLASASRSRFIEGKKGMWRVYQDEAMQEAPHHKWQAMTPLWWPTVRAAIDAARQATTGRAG